MVLIDTTENSHIPWHARSKYHTKLAKNEFGVHFRFHGLPFFFFFFLLTSTIEGYPTELAKMSFDKMLILDLAAVVFTFYFI